VIVRRMARALLAVAVLTLAACGSSSATSSAPPASPTPSGPPTATGTAQGDAGLAGPISFSSVSCQNPRPTGPAIRIFALAPGQGPTGIGFVISISAVGVNVRVASGSGATYAQREFNGTGVSNFDAARGAKVDSTLTENPAVASKPATIGVLTSISMTVDCANQQPGTASLKIAGPTPNGAISGAVTSPRVECSSSAQGNAVVVTALVEVAGKPHLVIASTSYAGITVALDGHFYIDSSNPATTGSASTTGGQWHGTVKEASTTNTLQITGSATCGSAIKT
jgi:hypothetical protein